MNTKVCFRCKVEKSVACFAASNGSKSPDKLSIVCLDCRDSMTPKQRVALETAWWRKNNAQRAHQNVMRIHYPKLYGITLENYQAMLDAQGAVCAICQQPETSIHRDGKVYVLAVDHDHVTGAVRGLLCKACNRGLADFHDDQKRITSAL